MNENKIMARAGLIVFLLIIINVSLTSTVVERIFEGSVACLGALVYILAESDFCQQKPTKKRKYKRRKSK